MVDSSEIEKPFLMAIEEVETIPGTGFLVEGRVKRGVIHVGDELEIINSSHVIKTTCLSLQVHKLSRQEACAGERILISLGDVEHYQVATSALLTKPGMYTAHARFRANLYIFTKEEGGRESAFFSGYMPKFTIFGISSDGTLELPSGVEGKPGETIDNVAVTLIAPLVMDAGSSFIVYEGSRKVALGTITTTW